MNPSNLIEEIELAALAKKWREASGKGRSAAARELGIAHSSLFHAEESPEKSFVKLRKRIIERYSPFKVVGPKYLLEKQ